MVRGPLARDDYSPHFSGHETFPLRYGWLKKAYDAVSGTCEAPGAKTIFSSDDAIARFGVGRNMVSSIRHWAIASGIIREGKDGFEPTPIGRRIFDDDGLDPYMEHPCTLWLVHWHLAGNPDKTTTWFWSFNHFHGGVFERNHLVKSLEALVKERDWRPVAASTIRRDVECLVRLYAAKTAAGKGNHEDDLESPLAELGLIRSVGRRDGFRFVRGSKPALGNGVFLYALNEFWNGHSTANALSLESIAHEPGSPGRVFLLDDDEVLGRVQELEDASAGAMRWSETAGLRQVIRDGVMQAEKAAALMISADYGVRGPRKAA